MSREGAIALAMLLLVIILGIIGWLYAMEWKITPLTPAGLYAVILVITIVCYVAINGYITSEIIRSLVKRVREKK